jgi:peptidoglycan hydrolase-like protein with peptidoglycan-binding domain
VRRGGPVGPVMRRSRMRAAVVLLAVLLVVAALVIATTGSDGPSAVTAASTTATGTVERGPLSATVSQAGILTYRAHADGSPYEAIGGATGTYTRLPDVGDRVGCGEVLYRVDDRPVLLLCGAIPAYRALRAGDRGRDVRQLNRALHRLGDDRRAHVRVDPEGRRFTSATRGALRVLQRRTGARATGTLAVGDVVVLPSAVRIATVAGAPGAPARPGTPVVTATSDDLHVQVDLDPSQQGDVALGDRARITLPGNGSVTGRVVRFGRVATAPKDRQDQPSAATVPTFLRLDDPAKARGLDQAPVQVDITTKGVADALSVPVTALVGRPGGGYAVEVVRAGGRRQLVAVRIGLFDDGGGRVQVDGALRAGDVVAVPSV